MYRCGRHTRQDIGALYSTNEIETHIRKKKYIARMNYMTFD